MQRERRHVADTKMMHKKRGCQRSKGADGSSGNDGITERKEDGSKIRRNRKLEHGKKGCWYQE